MSSVFTAFAGIYQGRIQNPVNHTVNEGSWTYVLGHDLKQQFFTLAPDDEVSVEQAAVFNDGDKARILGRVRLPGTLPPAGWKWVLDIEVIGQTFYSFDLVPTTFNGLTEFVITDDALGYNVSAAPGGNQTLRYTLRLDGPGPDPISAELPAVYIDRVAIDEVATPIFLNQRFPEDGQTGVPHTDQQVRVQVSDTTGIGLDTSTIEVTIAGTLAYDGGAGGFQTGFSGTATTTGISNSDFTLDVDLSLQTYTSEQTVSVRVVGDTTGGANSIDQTYTFTMGDIVAPEVVSATAVEKKLIRVVFNEDVKQVSSSNSDDALNPSNYVFTRTSTPAANVEATCVRSISATEVEVESDITLTFGASYLLATQNIEDTAGNVVTAPTSTAAFTGFVPLFPAGRRFDLLQMIPAIVRREDSTGDLKKFTSVLQEVTDLLLCTIDRFTDIVDIDIAPEFYVDLILCDLGNPFRFNLSLIDKRRLARVLVDIYREKGTCQGIVNASRFFLGVELDCDQFNVSDYWILGDSQLGDTTVLGPSEQELLYSFQMISAELQITDVTVNGSDDGDYTIKINSTDVTFTASSNTIQQIRDNLISAILSKPELPVTPTSVSTDGIRLTGDRGTAFTVAVTAPMAGNLTFTDVDTPTAFTDEQVARIKEIADYMKPAHTHCVRVVQPIPPALINHWELGISLLGETSILH